MIDQHPNLPAVPLLKRMMHWLGLTLGTRLVRLIYATCQWQVTGEATLIRHLQTGQSAIIAGWHENLICGILYMQGRGYTTVASLGRDGSLVSHLLSQLNWSVIRGSTSRGARSAYRQMINVLKVPGQALVVTPDGPRGPPKIAQAGAVRAAIATGAPIFPIAFDPNRCWRLSSWDGLKIAKPFATIRVHIAHSWLPDPSTAPNQLPSQLTETLQQAACISTS